MYHLTRCQSEQGIVAHDIMSIYNRIFDGLTSALFVVSCCWIGKRRQTMQIIIKGRQMQVTPQLRERIQRKVQRLERLLEEDARVEVTVSEEQTRSARDRYSVQLSLSSSSYPVRSEVSALNASTALDLVLDKVVAQLYRQKDRQKTVFRQHS